MNDKQPYEQHLADKLQQLPPPADVDQTWPQMKALLDKEMPRGGGFGGNGGGNGRRWIISIIAGIILIGTWLAREQFQATHQPGNTTASVPQNNPPTEKNNKPSPGVAGSATNQPKTTGDQPPGQPNDLPTNATATAPAAPRAKSGNAVAGTAASPENIPKKDFSATDHAPETTPVHTNKNLHEAITTHKNKDRAAKHTIEKNAAGTGVPGRGKDRTIITDINDGSGKTIAENSPTGSTTQADYPALLITSPELLTGNNINKNYAAQSALFANRSAKANTATAKAKTQKSKEHKTFAIGLSLPMTFPITDQKAMGYNINAGPNTVSDYLPSPHLQYHLNDKTFLQTEIQILSPQYIRPILLYQQKQYSSASSAWLYNSVYAKKLYYFNIPVSIYHSPMPHFYLGTGLQFSSLLGGVALYEDKKVYGPQETVTGERYAKFRNDSLSSRMNGAEMRLLLDFNYYWNRFTVGLRYNQAFSNYISFQLSNSSPYTYDKNRSLLFYLRVNLWEDIKQKTPRKTSLTLK